MFAQLAKNLRSIESSFMTAFKGADLSRLTKTMDNEGIIELAKAASPAQDGAVLQLSKQAVTSVADFFDSLGEDERRELLEILNGMGVQTIQGAGQVALVGVMGQDVGANVISEAVVRSWFEHSLSVSRGIVNNYSTQLVDIIAKDLVAGETKATMARHLSQKFNDLTVKHSAIIAQTESQAASQYGNLQGLHWGGSRTKSWQHFPGSSKQPRATHAAADGQTVKIDAPFWIGGYAAQMPGDFSLPASESISCHCNILPGDEE